MTKPVTVKSKRPAAAGKAKSPKVLKKTKVTKSVNNLVTANKIEESPCNCQQIYWWQATYSGRPLFYEINNINLVKEPVDILHQAIKSWCSNVLQPNKLQTIKTSFVENKFKRPEGLKYCYVKDQKIIFPGDNKTVKEKHQYIVKWCIEDNIILLKVYFILVGSIKNYESWTI